MLRLIPPPAHRVLLRSAHVVRLRWWRWRGRLVSGVRVLVRDRQGRVLLVRHSYGSGSWMLPGGGLKRGEDPIAAGRREVLEETGCRLQAPVLVAEFAEPIRGVPSRVDLVAGLCDDSPRIDGREIVEASFYAPDDLPEPLLAGLSQALPAWLAAADAAGQASGQSGIIW
ncbi:MAG: NUDIX domain-containing protein [Sphingomonadales bacterium]|nr:NUDIX domain-containing protein [Sphingomonadales bacterium]